MLAQGVIGARVAKHDEDLNGSTFAIGEQPIFSC